MAANEGNIHHGLDTFFDASTGKTYRYERDEDGNPIEVEQPAANVAGSFADLQRAGALVATKTGTFEDGVIGSPGVTTEQAQQGVVESAKAGEPVHPNAEKLIDRKGDEITAAGEGKSKK